MKKKTAYITFGVEVTQPNPFTLLRRCARWIRDHAFELPNG
jgi:hypothetical protein